MNQETKHWFWTEVGNTFYCQSTKIFIHEFDILCRNYDGPFTHPPFLFTEDVNKEEDDENLENEILPENAKKSIDNSLLGNVVMNATVANLKFKSKRNASFSKKRLPKPSVKGKSRSTSRSFLEENIKSAGKVDLHRMKRIFNADEDSLDHEVSSKDPEITLSSKDQGNVLDTDVNYDGKEIVRMLYEKETTDLQKAHAVLVNEYRRRREVRANIMKKFVRASLLLKMVIAQSRGWSDPDHKKSKKEVIKEVFVAKRYDDSENSEGRGRFGYNRFADADRI